MEDKEDKRVTFIFDQIQQLKDSLREYGSDLLVCYGKPTEVFERLLDAYPVKNVFANRDYEPSAIERDSNIKKLCEKHGVKFNSFKDQVIFEQDEVVKDDGSPYMVYTPYMKKWKSKLEPFFIKPYPTLPYLSNVLKVKEELPLIQLSHIGFEYKSQQFPSITVSSELLKKYSEYRDYPALNATSKLGLHLRFGTVSVRDCVSRALKSSDTWLNELIWREFFMMILYHYPHVEKRSFRPEYDHIEWRNNEQEFLLWSLGQTGFPMVDAGMRELNETGFMHNRVRMITASFLTKHLLIDWRWGEAYFAEKLLDYELAANNGNWQWAAGSGCDAAPYFRVFNPHTQIKKFDPQLKYIKKWVPEFEDPFSYSAPMVDHKFARERAISTYKQSLERVKG